MERKRAKQIITNLYEVRENFDELTSSVLEYCFLNNNTHSYSNLVTFVTKFKDTRNIFSKFRLLDVSQIIVREDFTSYKNLLSENHLNYFEELFTKVKFLVKYTNCEAVWYEVLDKAPTFINTKRIVLHGSLGKMGDVSLYSYGVIVDPLSDIQTKIREAQEEITKIVIENDRKRYYVKKVA